MLSMINKIAWIVCGISIALIIVLTLATKIIVKIRDKRDSKRNM